MKTMRILSLGFGLALVVAAACSSPDDRSSGVTDGGNKADAGEPTCGHLQVSDAPACQTCAESSCCSQMAACADGTPCNGLISCLRGCQDGACEQACQKTHADGVADSNALDDCTHQSCETECFPDPRLVCDSGVRTDTAECSTCAGDNCCQLVKDCVADQACASCMTDSSPAGCQSNARFAAAGTCVNSNCSHQCK